MQTLFLGFNRVAPREIASFQGKSFGIVSSKEARVHDDAPNDPRQSEPDDAPIEPRRPAAARFPAVHPFSAGGVFPFNENRLGFLEEIFLRGKKVVVGFEHATPEAFRG